MSQRVLLSAALVLGGLIAYVDTRPTWDDTGVTAGALFVATGIFGYLSPRRPWLQALALGIWIPLLGLAGSRNPWTWMALLVAFGGAYAGMGTRRAQCPIQAG